MKVNEITDKYTISLSMIEKKEISDIKRNDIINDYVLGRLWNKKLNDFNTHTVFTDLIEVNKSFINPYGIEELRSIFIERLKQVMEVVKELNIPVEIIDNNTLSDDEDVMFNFEKLPDGHLIKKYIQYGDQTQDAYLEYHFLNCLTLLSYIVPAYQSPKYGNTYNNIWGVGLGIAGFSGKSTTLNKLLEIIDIISTQSFVYKMANKPTPEAYVDELSKEGGNKQIWINDECVGLLKFMDRDYASELEDNILKTYSHSSFSSLTKKNGLKQVNNPHVPMLWYTTIENFARHSKYEKYETGFLQRPLYVLPKRHKDIKEDSAATLYEEALFKDIVAHCVKLYNASLKLGYIKFEENDLLNKWKTTQRAGNDKGNDIVRGARTRSYEHARKLAMLITIGSPEFLENMPKKVGDGQITIGNYIPDWAAKIAIEWTELFMKNFDKVYKISITNNGGNVQKIIKMLEENEYVKKVDLMDLVKKYGRQFDDIISELIADNVIQIVSVSSNGKGRPGTYYQLVRKEV